MIICHYFSEFDREKVSTYLFDAIATDSGLNSRRSSSVQVHITILDINDNSPVFDRIPYRAEIPLDFPVGQSVLTVLATDKDLGANGDVRYSLVNSSLYFHINDISGLISTKHSLDGMTLHTLKIKAEDRGSPPRHSIGRSHGIKLFRPN